jgi:hypothetical protein
MRRVTLRVIVPRAGDQELGFVRNGHAIRLCDRYAKSKYPILGSVPGKSNWKFTGETVNHGIHSARSEPEIMDLDLAYRSHSLFAMNDSIVLYRGPSQIDGSPIVVTATLGSSNEKTGSMIQTWILPEIGPLQASRVGLDSSVCGTCPRRHSLGGDCYVLIHNAPNSTWKAWDRRGRSGVNWDAHVLPLQQAARDHGLRLGAYGDPAAVPVEVWRNLISALQPTTITGYTHQWRNAFASEFRGLVMASCDTIADAIDASAAGWRFFAAIPYTSDATALPKSVQCLSDAKGLRCEDCGICDGARTGRDKQPASVWIAEHGARSGAKAKRAAALVVVR